MKNHTAAVAPHMTNAFKRTKMAGVSVGGRFFAFDCEEINLSGANLSEEELLPLLECFGRGQFTRVKTLKLVTPLYCTPHFDLFIAGAMQGELGEGVGCTHACAAGE